MGKKLTCKTFLLLAALSMAVCVCAYSCIWFFLPYAGQKRAVKELAVQTQRLVKELWQTPRAESGPLFLDFIKETGADLCLADACGQSIPITAFPQNGGDTHADLWDSQNGGDTALVLRYPFQFADARDEYLLTVCYNPFRTKEITDAVCRSVPFVAVSAMLFSFAGAWFFSCYTTRPVMRICQIASRMAKLDFSWYCPDVRDDGIGLLSRSINELSDRLHEALQELQRRNASLEDEILLEKERERRRMLFFSGISHELKTPIAVVTGQLEGMRAGIGVYKDHDTYLARSAQILQSLNQFLKEILMISHIDLSGQKEQAPVGLSRMLDTLLKEYAAFAEFSQVTLRGEIQQELYVRGEERLLKKAVGNIIGNAIGHSAPDAEVQVTLAADGGSILLSVVNAPAHIAQEHLPHLFEAFYRADDTAEHGSGLGLYMTRLIFESGKIPHLIENTADGVRFRVLFQRV